MEHMNFNAHKPKFQNQIINAYREVNKVTTLTTADQAIYQSKLKRLFMSYQILLIINASLLIRKILFLQQAD